MFSFLKSKRQKHNGHDSDLKNNQNMILLVGLGNPGKKYEQNRHNIGFMAIDNIADKHNFPTFRSKFQAALSENNVNGTKVILLKPQTYMNESGQSVQAAVKFYKLNPDQIYVFHDELDLEPSKVRFKTGGGNAGHNGLKSIQNHLGTPDFHRIRIGIGHPGHKDRVSGYVLSDFAKAEQDWVTAMVDNLADHSDLLFQKKMNDYIEKVSNNVALATGKGE